MSKIITTDNADGSFTLSVFPDSWNPGDPYPAGHQEYILQKGTVKHNITRNNSDPHDPALDVLGLKFLNETLICSGRGADFLDGSNNPYPTVNAYLAANRSFFFSSLSGGGSGWNGAAQITIPDAMAGDSAGTLSGKYFIEFTAPGGTHRLYFEATPQGKYPGEGDLYHANGEWYSAEAALVAGNATPADFHEFDMVQVTHIMDMRGNSVRHDRFFQDSVSENYIWSFWFGTDKVQGNQVSNGKVYSATGDFPIDGASGFYNNVVGTGASVYVINTPYSPGASPTGWVEGVAIAYNTFEGNGGLTLGVSGTYSGSDPTGTFTMIGCCIKAGSTVAVNASQTITLDKLNMSGSLLQLTASGAAVDSCTFRNSNLTLTGLDDPNDNFSYGLIDFDDTVVEQTMVSPASNLNLYRGRIEWPYVVLANESYTDLELTRSGNGVLLSNLTLEMETANTNDYDSVTKTLNLTGRGMYCGKVLLHPQSALVGTPTEIAIIDSSIAQASKRKLSIVCGSRRATSGGVNTWPSYAQITLTAAVWPIVSNGRVLGTGAVVLSSLLGNDDGSLGAEVELILTHETSSGYMYGQAGSTLTV